MFVPGGNLSYPWLENEPTATGTLADIVHQGRLGPFCIDKREVESVKLELDAANSCPPEDGICVSLGGTQPATCVTLERAECYCASSASGVKKRLPTAEEWLFAAVGETQRKFPWGDTWLPWGNDRYEGRPDNGRFGERFCARECVAAERSCIGPEVLAEFDSDDCASYAKTMDRSPYGVGNLASNALELTSLIAEIRRGELATPLFGLDHARENDPNNSLTYSGPPRDSLISSYGGMPYGPRVHISRRARKEIGFRCVVTERQSPNELTSPVSR